MPDLNDLINNITKLEERLKAELPEIVEVYAGDALALVWQRIEKEGAKKGATYSKEPMYASQTVFNRKGSFKARGKTLKKNKEAKTMYLPGGYEELRDIQGLPTNVVNLEYSGRLHQNTKILEVVKDSDFKAHAVIGATNQEEKKKLGGMFKKYGPFLDITPEISRTLNTGEGSPGKKILNIVRNTLG